MNLSYSITAIKDLFSFPFRDPQWKSKFLVGSLFTFAAFLIPVLPLFFVWGYIARLLRAGAKNEDASRLPAWDDWNDLLMDGLRQFGAIIIFTLPAAVVMGFGWLMYMGSMFSFAGIDGDPSGVQGRGAFFLFALFVFFLSIIVGMPLTFIAGILMPSAQAHVAVNRRFSAVFDARGWWRVLRANIGGYLIAFGLYYFMIIIMMIVFQFLYITIVLCIFAPLLLAPFSFYIMVVAYRIYGQLYGESASKAGIQPAAVNLLAADSVPETENIPPAETPAAA